MLHVNLPNVSLFIKKKKKAVTRDKIDTRGTYDCPVYQTAERGSTCVWNFHLKSKDKASRWVVTGTALLLQTS